MVVKNEDRFIWYAISSVLPYVKKLLICDTGSSDDTLKIIRSFKDKKIFLSERTISNTTDMAKLRDEQLKNTATDWFWIVDGDEIYSRSLCQEILVIVKNDGINLEGIVVRRYDLLGDIYHYQSGSVGSYNLFGKTGHFVLRLINKRNVSALHVEGKYPHEGYYDKYGREITTHLLEKFKFTEGKLFHAMYLTRSSKGSNLSDTYHRNKWKIELGQKLTQNMNFPEVFNSEKPKFIPQVTNKRSFLYEVGAYIITPVKMFKRKLDKV